jgi:DNA-binding NtrC family response regulator
MPKVLILDADEESLVTDVSRLLARHDYSVVKMGLHEAASRPSPPDLVLGSYQAFVELVGANGRAAATSEGGLRRAVEHVERRMITNALERTGGVQTRAAGLLGISERVLRYKLHKYGLDVDEEPPR